MSVHGLFLFAVNSFSTLQMGDGVIEDWFSYLDLILFVIDMIWSSWPPQWDWGALINHPIPTILPLLFVPSILNQPLYPLIHKDPCFSGDCTLLVSYFDFSQSLICPANPFTQVDKAILQLHLTQFPTNTFALGAYKYICCFNTFVRTACLQIDPALQHDA